MPDHRHDPTARRAVVASGVVAVLIVVGATIAVVRAVDETPPSFPGATPVPTSVLDEVFPDRPAAAPDAGEVTPDPLGSARAEVDIDVTEVAWTPTDFGEVQTLVVLHHRGTEAFLNVAAEVSVVDARGATLERIEHTYRRIDPGQTVAATTFVASPMDAIATLEVVLTARGTAPAGPGIDLADIAWEQDAIGTVTVTGQARSDELHEFVAMFAVLRGDDGAFVGSAFGLVDAIADEPRQFELFGFPAERVSSIEVYAGA